MSLPDNSSKCPLCLNYYHDINQLKLHIINCRQLDDRNIHLCQDCKKTFTRKSSLNRHYSQNRCKILKKNLFSIQKKDIKLNPAKIIDMTTKKTDPEPNSEKMKILEDRIDKLEKSGPKVVNNNLQIVCVGSNDNYLDMLTEEWGSFDKALEYIRDCALSQLTGDCKLIEKIYLSLRPDGQDSSKSIRFTDKSQTKIEYYNEDNEVVKDTRELFGRKLANNLQNSYLKGVNYLLKRNMESRTCPNKFLEEYDLQTWNGHIYELSDIKYQKKIIGQLNISQAT